MSPGHKIHGRVLSGNGTPRTPIIPIFEGGTSNLTPDVAYNRVNNEYTVVWEDWRRELSGPDIFGIRVNKDGKKIWSPRSEADTSFAVCDHDSAQWHPKIAHNYKDNCYLVVWHDERHNYRYGSYPDEAIYGQCLFWNANLLPPLDTPSTKENFMIGEDLNYRDRYPDVAYHGGMGGTLNEFFVVFQRFFSINMLSNSRIWGARVKGNNGKLLNSWGIEFEPANKLTKTSGGPPWGRDMVVSWDRIHLWGGDVHYIDGSPHGWGNDYWVHGMGKSANRERYPVPEFMVSWTSFKTGNPDIMVQRVAYFPDSTAYRLGMKQTQNGTHVRGPDSNWVAVLLDTAGNWANPAWQWITWEHYAACSHPSKQSYNDLNYNQSTGEFLVVWNDWRQSGNAADVYGQHLAIDPADSSLEWTDPNGVRGADPQVNTPIAASQADEGNYQYPCVAYGVGSNAFLVGYEYDVDADNFGVGVHGMMHAGAPTWVEKITTTEQPEQFILVQNFPNPFNPVTTIEFSLPMAERAVVRVFDALGREIAVLKDRDLIPGTYRVHWTGEDASGRQVSSGIYFYRIEAGRFSATAKMVLMR